MWMRHLKIWGRPSNKFKILVFIISIVITVVIEGRDGFAQTESTSPSTSTSPSVSAVSLRKLFSQYLQWEQTKNFSPYQQTERIYPITFVPVPSENIGSDFDRDLPDEIREIFLPKDSNFAYIPIHPLANQDNIRHYPKIPQANAGANPLTKKGAVALSASRTLFFYGLENSKMNIPKFQLKIPTDRLYNPDLPKQFNSSLHYQPDKAELGMASVFARARAHHIRQIDLEKGTDPHLKFLFDVGTIRMSPDSRHPKNAFLIRDITPLLDGYLYLPAFSIPYVGKEIAEKLGKDPIELWGKAYAKALGKAKAKLLLRYGLQMETPNSQNFLIQLDAKTWQPTGQIVIRDLEDTRFLEGVINGLDADSYWAAYEKMRKGTIDKYLYPFWTNSTWRFTEEDGKLKLTSEILLQWGRLHHQAYLDEINRCLKVKLEPLPIQQSDSSLENMQPHPQALLHFDFINIFQRKMRLHPTFLDFDEFRYLVPIQKLISSPEGKIKLAHCHDSLKKESAELCPEEDPEQEIDSQTH